MDEIKEQFILLYGILSDPKLTKAIADMCWNLYQDLKKKGFTDEQAIGIVTTMAGKNSK